MDWTQCQHLHVSNSKETSKTVCQTKQILMICQSDTVKFCRKLECKWGDFVWMGLRPVVKLQEVMTLVHCTGIISNLATA